MSEDLGNGCPLPDCHFCRRIRELEAQFPHFRDVRLEMQKERDAVLAAR